MDGWVLGKGAGSRDRDRDGEGGGGGGALGSDILGGGGDEAGVRAGGRGVFAGACRDVCSTRALWT